MASTSNTSNITRKRILANVQERQKSELPEARPDEDTMVESRADDAERILSQPVKVGRKKRKKKKQQHRNSVAHVTLLGAIVVGGIAVIIGLRYLAEAFGVKWIGD